MNLNLTILGQMISFIFFVGCCMKYVWPPLITTIERRQKKIADDLAYAENLKSKSDIIKQEADEYLRQTQIKVKTLIDQANEHKIKILNEAKKEAQYEHTKILIKAREEIKLERNQIYEEIRCKLAALIILGVEKIIERSVNRDLHDDIINSVINSLHD